MVQSPQYDPLAVAIISSVLGSGKPWARPTVTSHIWAVEFAEPLPRGTHVVTIRVMDHFGRTHEQSKIFGR